MDIPNHAENLQVTKAHIQSASSRIRPFLHLTPILTCQSLTTLTDCKYLGFKSENLQKVGAFKPRGAFNKLLQLSQDVKVVCTHSSGNHAQGLAYAAKILGFSAHIVMPHNSSTIKRNAVHGYGATVISCGNTIQQREKASLQVQQKYGAIFVHPYDDLDIIAGQATCAMQIFEELGNLDYLICPIGGGGLMAGTLLANKYFGGKCTVIGVQPEKASDAYQSLLTKTKQPQMPPISIADGLRTSLGQHNFKIISKLLPPSNVILVSEEEIIAATKLYMERIKIVIEPSSATVLAAALKDSRFHGKNVCCIVSGGNIDLESLAQQLRKEAKL